MCLCVIRARPQQCSKAWTIQSTPRPPHPPPPLPPPYNTQDLRRQLSRERRRGPAALPEIQIMRSLEVGVLNHLTIRGQDACCMAHAAWLMLHGACCMAHAVR